MGKLVEATHVTLGGEVGTNDWAFPYLDEQHSRYAMELLTEADGLLSSGDTRTRACRSPTPGWPTKHRPAFPQSSSTG